MTKSAPAIPKTTEAEWLEGIATAVSTDRDAVAAILRKHGVAAHSGIPRARQVSFTSVAFAGTKDQSDDDGPFSFDWSPLTPGLWAVMSDVNLRGKSSVMNILQAALRGDFPHDIKPDVWRWLSTISVGLQLDGSDYRIGVTKPCGVDVPAGAEAELARRSGDEWLVLYQGDLEGLKAHVETLFMEELGFSRLQAVNDAGTRYEHGWPAVAACLSIGGNAEGVALFGETIWYGLPQRLLQLFIGMPWIPTLAAIATAKKVIASEAPPSSDPFASVRARIASAESDLAAVKRKAPASSDRAEARRRIVELEADLATKQSALTDSRTLSRSLREREESSRSEMQSLSRLVQELRDERDAGYVFRNLRPERCPACEANFHGRHVHVDDGQCVLCKSTVEPEEDIGDERLSAAEGNLQDVTAALRVVAAEAKAATRSEEEAEKSRDMVSQEILQVQATLAEKRDDPELRIAELEATIRELKALVKDVGDPKPDLGIDKAVLEAAEKRTKTIIESFQTAVLADVAAALMRLSTRFGVGNLSEAKLNGAGHLKLIQGGADTSFSKLTKGERLRVKIAAALAAVEIARDRGLGRHPGLLLLDSPKAEEVVDTDFLEMLKSVSKVATEMGGVQVIIGTIHQTDLDDVVPFSNRRHATGNDYLF